MLCEATCLAPHRHVKGASVRCKVKPGLSSDCACSRPGGSLCSSSVDTDSGQAKETTVVQGGPLKRASQDLLRRGFGQKPDASKGDRVMANAM